MSASQAISEELQEKIKDLFKEGYSGRSIAEKLGIGETTVRKYKNRINVKFYSSKRPENTSETQEFTSNTWTISLPETRINSFEQLVEKFKIDLSIWEPEKFICGTHEMGMKPPATTEYMETSDGRTIPAWVRFDKEPVVTPLYAVKAILKKKIHIVDAKREIEALKAFAKNYAPKPPYVKKPEGYEPYSLELAIVDHHFGKLGWKEETGYESYDIKIAEQVYWRAFDSLIQKAKPHKLEEILLVVGNDLLQMDSVENTTTKGTQVSTDGRYYKVFTLVRDTIIKSVEECRKYAKTVKVYFVQGNHDSQSVWTLGSSVEMFFYKYKDVEINNAPLMRKYWQYGKNMLLLTHGHTTKPEKLPLLMATEKPQLFGATKYREAHIGHRHTKQSEIVIMKDVIEDRGVRVRTLPALTGVDDWHADLGYVGNLRQSEAFLWHKNKGIVATFTYTEDE